MIKKILLTFVLVISAGTFAACNMLQQTPTEDAMMEDTTMQDDAMMQEGAMEIQLDELNDSGQYGTARLDENEDGQLVVTVNLVGGNFEQPQPAHIHVGSCPGIGAIEYPLTSVVDGSSITILDVTLDEVTNVPGGLALNVHQSAEQADIYTACGDLL